MRRELIRFLVCGATALAAFVSILDAQITVPFPTFTAGTIIQPSEINANFAKFADACNRTGCTMTGTLTSQQITPATTATYDLGVTGTRFRDGWFSRDVTAATFAGNGAALTALAESNITDGAVLARVAANETISGAWTYSNAEFWTGVISPSTITADQNDYAPTGFSTANVVRLSHNNAGASRSITGLAGGASGRRVLVCNVNASGSAESFVLISESASSSAANRFATGATLAAGNCAEVWYDGTSSRWRVVP